MPESRLAGGSNTAATKPAQPPAKPRDFIEPDAPRAAATAPSPPGKARDAAPGSASKVAAVASVATGSLKIVILPWAEVWIDGKPMGQTPLRTTLSAGPHRIRLKNDAKEKTVHVNVTPSRLTVIDETW
jgi:serine/threonine-protein kinase